MKKRAVIRKDIAVLEFHSLSLTLNIPGYPKSNKLLSVFFSDVLGDLFIYLEANRIFIDCKKKFLQTDEAGSFFIIPLLQNRHLTIFEIKQRTETFEENHKLGRLIDIDIFNKYGEPVSSGKEKACYYCGKFSAVSCMRNKRHSYKKIRIKIFEEITTFLEEKTKEKQIDKICNLAQRALLYEISISNKPGLVCFESSGVHRDMNFFSFINSTSALLPFFRECCELGYHYQGDINNVLPEIRTIGLQAEKVMFKATKNVNTHKGIIFLFGISLFTISKILSKNINFTDLEFQNIIKNIGKDLVKNELSHLNDPKTHGEKVFQKYGMEGAGIRLEIENGLSTIFQTAIPYFSKNLHSEVYKEQTKLQEVLFQGLLLIMAKNNDTNILFRSDLDTLKHIKELANRSVSDPKTYDLLADFCTKNRLSPGGSADLLAVSLFLHFIKTEYHEL